MIDNPVQLVLHVFYDVLAKLTGIVGLTPLQVLEIAGVLLLVFFVVATVNSIRGKTKFSLGDGDD